MEDVRRQPAVSSEAARRRTVGDRAALQWLTVNIALPLRQRTARAKAALWRVTVSGGISQQGLTANDRAALQWLTVNIALPLRQRTARAKAALRLAAVSGEAAQGRIAHIAFFRRRGMACAKAV